MSRSILAESVAILGIAVVLGTAVHVLRTDTKQKIPFMGTYTRVYDVPPPPKSPADPGSPSIGKPPAPENPAPPPSGGPYAPKPLPEKPVAPQEPSPIRDITAEEAIEEHKKGDTPFLDARRTARYEQGHIPRAKPFSVWEADIDQRISALLGEVPADIPLIIYCSGGDCVDSHMLAEKLKTAGYMNLRIFLAGFPEWQKRGLPVEKSEGAPDAPPGGEEESK